MESSTRVRTGSLNTYSIPASQSSVQPYQMVPLVHVYVPRGTNGPMVATNMVHRVPWYHMVRTRVLQYHGTIGTMVRVPWYTCTMVWQCNIAIRVLVFQALYSIFQASSRFARLR
jgi:hypothetical protein